MNMSDLYIGAYWQPRKESVHACAGRLHKFLACLSACDDVFQAWYRRGKSAQGAKQIAIDFKAMDRLVELLERGRNRTDVGNEIIEEFSSSRFGSCY